MLTLTHTDSLADTCLRLCSHTLTYTDSLQNARSRLHTLTASKTHAHTCSCLHTLTASEMHTHLLSHAYRLNHTHMLTCSHTLTASQTCLHAHTDICSHTLTCLHTDSLTLTCSHTLLCLHILTASQTHMLTHACRLTCSHILTASQTHTHVLTHASVSHTHTLTPVISAPVSLSLRHSTKAGFGQVEGRLQRAASRLPFSPRLSPQSGASWSCRGHSSCLPRPPFLPGPVPGRPCPPDSLEDTPEYGTLQRALQKLLLLVLETQTRHFC